MVETLRRFYFMRSRLPSRASAFGSCKRAWYYRCLGLDP
ncbi:hypothetical protein PHAVU_003G027801 [Phaseolus vulgaris]